MIIETINIRNVQVYIEKDKEGYISLSTDGYLPGTGLDLIIKHLRDAQDEDDRAQDADYAQHNLEMRMAIRY